MSSIPPESTEQFSAIDGAPSPTPGETTGTLPRRRVIIGEPHDRNGATTPAVTPYLGPPKSVTAPRRTTSPIVAIVVIGIVAVGIAIAMYLLPGLSGTKQSSSATRGTAGQPTSIAGGNVLGQPTATTDQTTNPTGTPVVIETVPPDEPAAGLGTPMPDEGNAHVADGTLIIYKNYPPTSGSHYPSTANPGFYEQSVPEGYFVHSMEHGAAVLYYNPDLPDATKQKLKELMTQLPLDQYGKVRIIIVPYTNMPTPLAIAAWRRLLLLNDYNFDEIKTFYQQWVDKGPENVP